MLKYFRSQFQTPLDWSLPIDIFRRVVLRWTLPDIDMFATMVLTVRFFAWGDAPEAEALDALAQP